MAVPTNTFKTYEAVGIREDLSDLIKVISPLDTLFYSSLSEGGANNTKVEWQSDSLRVAAANKHLQGDDETTGAVTPTTRLYNNTQIQKESFVLANTIEKVKKAGRVSEKDYQTAKKAKELSKDVEYAFLRGVRTDGTASVAPEMRGILNWVITNLSKASDATLNADGTVSGGTARDFTEELLKETLQNIFNSGGNVTTAYMPAALKQKVSSWVNNSTANYRTQVTDKKMNAVVDVYVSDFGSIKLVPHRDMPSGTVLLIDPAHKGKKGTLRNTHREQLAVTGDNQKWVMRVEHTLRDVAEAAHGRMTNLQ